MRLMDCIRLRVKDIDFAYNQIVVLTGKAEGSCRAVATASGRAAAAASWNGQALASGGSGQGYGAVYMPHALARKYPQAPTEWGWQYVFPSARLSVDPRRGAIRRHHVHEMACKRR